MKKSILRGGLIAFAVLLGLPDGSAALEAQPKEAARQVADAGSTRAANNSSKCKNLANFLSSEYRSNTKPLKGNDSVRLLGLQEKDAEAKALELAIKLNAKPLDVASNDLHYQLPDGLGSIVVRAIYDDSGVFVKLTLAAKCEKLLFTELWFVSLKRYNRE